MNIYIDYDDCLCETARFFSGLLWKMFGKDIPYEDIWCFNLQQSFSLDDKQYEEMMHEAHKAEALMSYEETIGAVDTVNGWIDAGYDVSVITGRSYSYFEPSRAWLDEHGLDRAKLYCLNKYGREGVFKGSEYSLELEDYKKMHFDIAVEDSPYAFKFFTHLPKLKVLVFDRPWNRECEFLNDNYYRCNNWEMIRNMI